MQNKKLISIIIPIYNVEKYLFNSLNSVLNQTFIDFEVIMVNDGSTDSSASIAQNFVDKDARFRLVNQENAGPSVARNNGIEKATGEYLTFLDADDWLSTDYLEQLVHPMLEQDVDLVCGGYFEVNPKFPKGLALHDFPSQHQNKIVDKKTFQSNLFKGVTGVLWAKLFKKEIFIQNQIQLHPKLRLSEDILAVFDYSKYVKKVSILSIPIYYYNRLDENGLSGKANIKQYQNLEIFIEEILSRKKEINFLDINGILVQRKLNFICKLLKDNSQTKSEFYKICDFVVEQKIPFNQSDLLNNQFDKSILKMVSSKKFFLALSSIRIYQALSKIKNG